MMARARPLVSILERGDSYEPLAELMGGRVINVDLDGRETLNPWDLPLGEAATGAVVSVSVLFNTCGN